MSSGLILLPLAQPLLPPYQPVLTLLLPYFLPVWYRAFSDKVQHRLRRLHGDSLPRPISPFTSAPLFLQRSVNGRQTPDEAPRVGGGSC